MTNPTPHPENPGSRTTDQRPYRAAAAARPGSGRVRFGAHPDAPRGGGCFAPETPNIDAVEDSITRLHDIERQMRALEAARQEAYVTAYNAAVAEASRIGSRGVVESTIPYRSVKAMLAASLHLSEATIGRHLERAHTELSQYPMAHEALATGEVSHQQVSIIIEAGSIIAGDCADDSVTEARHTFEELTIEYAKAVSPNLLRPYARKIAEQFATLTIDERHAQVKRFRKVAVQHLDDGMALLLADLSAEDAQAVFSRLTLLAKDIALDEARAYREAVASARETEAEPPKDERRTLDEIRADLLADFLKHGTEDRAIAPEKNITGVVQVVVHEAHLASDEAEAEAAIDAGVPLPELEGHGPIPVRAARRIAGKANKWLRITVDEDSGLVCNVDSRSPSTEQQRMLLVRDQHCRWPGCRMPLHRCEIDHTVPVEDGGPTSMHNLGALCRNHHVLKHHGGWNVTQHRNADYEWVSPTGEVFITSPQSRLRFGRNEAPPPRRRSTRPPNYGAPPPPRPEEYAPQKLEDDSAHPF